MTMLQNVIKLSGILISRQFISNIKRDFMSSKMYLDSRKSTVDNLMIYEKYLSTMGLTEKQSADLMLLHPEILSHGTEKLERAIDSLMRCQFGNEKLVTLVLTHPYILCTDPDVIEKTYMNLAKTYKKSTSFKMLINAPNILNEEWAEVEKKMRYLEDVMLSSISEIANSGALNYTLEYIKQRHTFLYKVGVFKKLSPKLKPEERLKVNPGLDRILNSSDDEFARKIAGVSLWEFEVYKQLFDPDEEDND